MIVLTVRPHVEVFETMIHFHTCGSSDITRSALLSQSMLVGARFGVKRLLAFK